MTNKERLNHLLRMNAGKGKLIQLLEKIKKDTDLSQQDFYFIDLLTSDSLWKRMLEFFQSVRADSSLSVTFTSQDTTSLKKKMIQASDLVSSIGLYIFFQESDTIGALGINAKNFFANAVQLLEIDGNCIYGCSSDFNNGVMLDLEVLSDDSRRYEVMAWGNQWLSALRTLS